MYPTAPIQHRFRRKMEWKPSLLFWLIVVPVLVTALSGAQFSHAAGAPYQLQQNSKNLVYISAKDARQIMVFEMDDESGQLAHIQSLELPGEPGALAIGPQKKRLFAALRSTGELASLEIDQQSGQLNLINIIKAGPDPAHLSIDPTGHYLLTAYYVDAKISVHRIAPNGKLLAPAHQVVPTEEKAHAIVLSPSVKFAFAPHTGPNKIYQFQWNSGKGTLEPNQPFAIETPPRSGPRHLVWHPEKPIAYVDNEQGSSVSAYPLNVKTGQLAAVSTVTTLPAEFADSNSTAEIQIHPSGRWLYVSNRGHNSLARIEIDAEGLQLKWISNTPTEAIPRSFTLTDDGRWLIAAGQGSGAVQIYRVDPQNGQLTSLRRREISPGLWWVTTLRLSK